MQDKITSKKISKKRFSGPQKSKRFLTKQKLERYFQLTLNALEKIKKNIIKGKESSAKEIISMASNYISDAEHFRKKEDFVNSFAALNYAHGWIDSGVRLGIFDVNDDKLFTIK